MWAFKQKQSTPVDQIKCPVQNSEGYLEGPIAELLIMPKNV